MQTETQHVVSYIVFLTNRIRVLEGALQISDDMYLRARQRNETLATLVQELTSYSLDELVSDNLIIEDTTLCERRKQGIN